MREAAVDDFFFAGLSLTRGHQELVETLSAFPSSQKKVTAKES